MSLLIIPVGSDPLLVAALLEAEGLRDRCAVKGIFIYEDEGEFFVGALQAALTDRSLAGPRGCQYTVMRLLKRSLWEEAAVQINVCNIIGLVADLRSVKESGVVEAMEKAVEIVEGVFEKMRNLLKAGASEKELATAVQRGRTDRGCGLGHPGAVAWGERTAFPHAQPSDRCVEAGDLVWFDVCAEADGLHSDLTCTSTVGESAPRLKEIYDVACEPQKKAREAIRLGMKCSEVTESATAILGKLDTVSISHTGPGTAWALRSMNLRTWFLEATWF